MSNKSKRDSPLPSDWVENYVALADLEASYLELTGCRHFYAETMRGRIRSFQLRFREAWDHFENAATLIQQAEETIPNLVRQFLLEIYRFENALVESPVDPDVELPEFSIPFLESSVLEQYPEVKLVLTLRKVSEATLRLHLGQCKEAGEILKQLIADSSDALPAQLAFYYVGLAACQFGNEEDSDALRNLENASFAAQTIGETLNAALLSARLLSVYQYLDKREEAGDWRNFLMRLTCPQPTKNVFLERAELLTQRCMEHSRLVIF